jgi:type II secretory pathway pseudopilin PulG
MCTAAPRGWGRTGGPMRTGEVIIRRTRAGGFTLLGILFLVAVLGVGLAGLGKVWETVSRREKEAQLLFVGDQYRRAIESYYRSTPGQVKHAPRALAELLADPRFPNTVRHLRKLYPDPIDNARDWELVKQGDEIIGIHSRSAAVPMKTGGFAHPYEAFSDAASYQDWVFVATTQTEGASTGKASNLKSGANGNPRAE